MAAMEWRGEERVNLIWKTDALSQPPTVIGSRSMKIQGLRFLKDDVLGVSLWQPIEIREDRLTKTVTGKFYLTDLEGKDWREPILSGRAASRLEEREQQLSSPTLLDPLPNDPDNILVVNNRGPSSGDVLKVDVRTNRAERIQRREEAIGGQQTDLNGELRARVRSDRDDTDAFVAAEIRDPATGAWTEHFRSYVKDRDRIEIVGFAADPNTAFVSSNVGRDRAEIHEYDIRRRKRLETLFSHRFFEAGAPLVWDVKGPSFGEGFGLTYAGPTGEVEWVSPRMRAIEIAIRQSFKLAKSDVQFTDTATGETATVAYDGGLGWSLFSISQDLQTLVFAISSPDRPPSFYLMKDNKITLLSHAFPDIDAATFGTTKFTYYKARDVQVIPAMLTTPNPALCGPGPWPAVVHPHGGPWARDDLEFDFSMWAPLIASRCMAVLRPQFRGGDGWGRKLWKAGDAEWGQKMQDDKDDGAKWMIDQKVAIPGRIAMFGFSYGGYSAFAAAARPNGLYKCAIAGDGVSDINRIVRNFYTNPFFREPQGPTIAGLNPLDQADQIKIPLMIYHGDRDQTAPVEQSQWFNAKAQRSGQPVEYRELDLYAHGPAWTRAIFGQQLGLIETYLKSGCGGAGL